MTVGNRIDRLLVLAALLVMLIFSSTLATRIQDCSSPPQGSGTAWAQAYRAWCSRCCGMPYTDSGNNPACNPGPNWGCKDRKDDSRSDSQPREDPEEARRKEEEARRKEAEERERAEQERAREAEAKRRAEEQRKFERDKQELLNNIKGTDNQSGESKGAGEADVKPKGGTDFFRIKGNPTTDLTFKGGNASSSNIPTAWRQLFCGVYISNSAATAALKGNFDEANYLAEQTRRVMGDGKVEVLCPDAPSPPEPFGQSELSQKSPPPLVRLYELLTKSTAKEIARLDEIHKRFPDLHKEKEKRHKEVVEKKMELQQIRAKPVNIRKPEEVREKRSAVAEALAALNDAVHNETEADDALKEDSEATTTLIRNREIYAKAQAKPDQAPDLLAELEVPKTIRRK